MNKHQRGGIGISIKWGVLELDLKVRGLKAFLRSLFGDDDNETF